MGRKSTVSGKCSRRRCHGERGTSWVEVGGWVDILKSSSTGWIASWLGFWNNIGKSCGFSDGLECGTCKMGIGSCCDLVQWVGNSIALGENWIMCIGNEDGAGLIVAAGGDTLLV